MHLLPNVIADIASNKLFPSWELRWHIYNCTSCQALLRGKWTDPGWGTPLPRKGVSNAGW
jgi:hypothetical protein